MLQLLHLFPIHCERQQAFSAHLMFFHWSLSIHYTYNKINGSVTTDAQVAFIAAPFRHLRLDLEQLSPG